MDLLEGRGRFCQEGWRADMLGVRGGSFLERCGGSIMGKRIGSAREEGE